MSRPIILSRRDLTGLAYTFLFIISLAAMCLAAFPLPGHAQGTETSLTTSAIPSPPFNRFAYLGMNVQMKPFDDARVRLAVYLLLDRGQLATIGHGEKVLGIIEPFVPNPGIDRAQDIAQARQLLWEAGYPYGFSITLTVSTSKEDWVPGLAKVISDYLAQAGIDCVISDLELTSFRSRLEGRNVTFFLDSTEVVWEDRPELLRRLFLTKGISNFTGYSNAVFDECILAGAWQEAENRAFNEGSGLAIVPIMWYTCQPPSTTLPPPPLQRPDLTISPPDFWFEDDGRSLVLSVTVTNRGDTASPETQLRAENRDRGQPSGVAVVPPLPVGESRTVEVRLDVSEVSPGSLIFIAVVDPDSLIEEANEDNNRQIVEVNKEGAGIPWYWIAGPAALVVLGGAFVVTRWARMRYRVRTGRLPARRETQRAKLPARPETHGAGPASTEAEALQPAASIETPTVERYVNLWFTQERTEGTRIERHQALVKGHPVYLQVQIAPYDENTLLAEARPFPSQEEIERAHPEVEGKPIPLEVTLFGNDFEVPEDERTQKLMLVRGRPTKAIYFQVKPQRLGMSHLRVCVFYQNHLLQALALSASVAEQPGYAREPQQALVETTFSADFANAAKMQPRRLWLGINKTDEYTHALNIKGTNVALSRTLGVAKIEGAIGLARRALREVAFETDRDEQLLRYRFGADNGPTKNGVTITGAEAEKRFKDDMIKLAGAGSYIYEAVLGSGAVVSGEDAAQVKPLVKLMKSELRGRSEKVIQIVRMKSIEDIWPWAIMYDLLIDSDPAKVKDVCLVFRDANGKAKTYEDCIKHCRHPELWERMDKTVVCPYGFWGFRHIIEQPYRQYKDREKAFADLPTLIRTGLNPVLKMPVEVNLISKVSEHREAMEALHFAIIDSYTATRDACQKPPEPHVMYFLCHGVHEPGTNPYLIIGNNENLPSSELAEWGINWAKTHTLVFINGCHTVDLEPKSLSMIMAPFVEADVSGIIGTEIAVHVFLASWFASNFFHNLLPDGEKGSPVGGIIRDLRLELLGKYNPLGLVYTPYCSADLHIIR